MIVIVSFFVAFFVQDVQWEQAKFNESRDKLHKLSIRLGTLTAQCQRDDSLLAEMTKLERDREEKKKELAERKAKLEEDTKRLLEESRTADITFRKRKREIYDSDPLLDSELSRLTKNLKMK